MNAPITRRVALVAISLTFLTNCGFHLRGKFSPPASITPLYIESDDIELLDALTDRFTESDIKVVEQDADDTAVLRFTKVEFAREIRTSDDQGLATGYTYSYELEFEIEDDKGVLARRDQSISLTRALDAGEDGDGTSFSDDTLIIENEESFLKEEMHEEIAKQILQLFTRL